MNFGILRFVKGDNTLGKVPSGYGHFYLGLFQLRSRGGGGDNFADPLFHFMFVLFYFCFPLCPLRISNGIALRLDITVEGCIL